MLAAFYFVAIHIPWWALLLAVATGVAATLVFIYLVIRPGDRK